jgi:hypothetical protein
LKRKDFLQSVLGASAFLGLPFTSLGADSTSIQDLINNTKRNVDGSMFGFASNPIMLLKISENKNRSNAKKAKNLCF